MSQDWKLWDHGSPAVDQFWRKVLSRGRTIQRHASLGGAIPSEDASYVPPEFALEQRLDVDPDLDTRYFPPSFFICEAIWQATP